MVLKKEKCIQLYFEKTMTQFILIQVYVDDIIFWAINETTYEIFLR